MRSRLTIPALILAATGLSVGVYRLLNPPQEDLWAEYEAANAKPSEKELRKAEAARRAAEQERQSRWTDDAPTTTNTPL